MSTPTKIGLQDLLRASHVKRWHLCNVSKEQTLADHGYMVATIALQLYHHIMQPTAANTTFLAGHEIALLTMAALYHDATEVRTGDIPTPGKRLLKGIAGSTLFDSIDNTLLPDLPFMGIPRSECSHLSDFVEMADKIEAAAWIRENGVGPRAMEVADKCWYSMEMLVSEFELETNGPWRSAVNLVLEALMCPRLRSDLS